MHSVRLLHTSRQEFFAQFSLQLYVVRQRAAFGGQLFQCDQTRFKRFSGFSATSGLQQYFATSKDVARVAHESLCAIQPFQRRVKFAACTLVFYRWQNERR